jgi:FlaA1/EpsC-like NDP-sugar epimerase
MVRPRAEGFQGEAEVANKSLNPRGMNPGGEDRRAPHSSHLPLKTENLKPKNSMNNDKNGIYQSRLVALAIRHRVVLLGLAHGVLFGLLYWLAAAIRFDFEIPGQYRVLMFQTLPLVIALKLLTFGLVGHYHGWLTHVSFSDMLALFRASVIATTVLFLANMVPYTANIPRSILFIDFLLTVLAFAALRSAWRAMEESFPNQKQRKRLRAALLVGADRSAGVLAQQIHGHPATGYRIVGFLSTNGERRGQRLGQIRVQGSLEDLPHVAARTKVRHVLVSVGSISGSQLRELKEVCDQNELTLQIIPSLEEVFSGSDTIPVRDIEIDDLLRRAPVQLDDGAIGELLQEKRILVTGAGGSIGSEICRQLIRFQPAELILLGRGENRIFAIEAELRRLSPATRLVPVIASITDQEAMRHVFETYRPELVFHAAAHKHVPLMEFNVREAIRNNVTGTRILADLADEFDVRSFVLISTDKAVNPTSVMGTTKHLGERYVNALSSQSSTCFLVVRFGNVLGSAGSVVPIFREQIRKGGPITITDKRMRRFFMTIPEASQLVLQATSMGKGGEIFVLDMGDPVAIVDLARDMIRLSGLPMDAIEIQFSGVRPGEKLYEELYFGSETSVPTGHPKVRAAMHRPFELDEVRQGLDALEAASLNGNPALKEQLSELVPEYQPDIQTQPISMAK